MNSTITQAGRRGKAKGFRGVAPALLAFLVCWAAPTAAEEVTPLVFIHGIKGSELLSERLKQKVALDFETARRLFTLICVLHWKG